MMAVLSLLLLILVANGAPVLGHALCRDRLGWPLDLGVRFWDGYPLLGPGKTVRGLVLSLGATTGCAWLIGLPVLTGVLLSGAAMLGDCLSSFLKRRLGKASGSQMLGVDQIPESLLPLLSVRNQMALGITEIVATVIAFLVVELLLSRLVYPWGLRKHPY